MLVVLSAKMYFTFFLNVQLMNTSEISVFLIVPIYGAIDIMLYGSEKLTEAQTVDIVTAVQTFM